MAFTKLKRRYFEKINLLYLENNFTTQQTYKGAYVLNGILVVGKIDRASNCEGARDFICLIYDKVYCIKIFSRNGIFQFLAYKMTLDTKDLMQSNKPLGITEILN